MSGAGHLGTSFRYACAAAVLALAMVLLCRLLRRLGCRESAAAGYAFILPWILGSWTTPGMWQVAASSVPDWDGALLGMDSPMNPLFHSALVPLVLSAVLLSVKRLNGLLAGLAVGFAANLLWDVVAPSAPLHFVPGDFLLDRAWLLGNAVMAFTVGYLVLSPEE